MEFSNSHGLCFLVLLVSVSFGYWCEGCLVEERNALLDIRRSINYPNGSSLSNWVGDDCCNWYGVSCDSSTFRVTFLELFRVREEGLGRWYLNTSLFATFKELTFLHLAYNEIGGWTTPQGFNELQSLDTLYLEGNRLNDSASLSGLCNLRNLQLLSLGDNSIEDANLPSCLGSLSKLMTLYLSENNLKGGFLRVISQIENLTALYLYDNKLNESGSSLSGLCNLRNLGDLSLSRNNLEDIHLPSCFGNLSNLIILDLSTNNLKGGFSRVIGRIKSLTMLDLGWNRLNERSSSLSGLHGLHNLDKLSLNGNYLTDDGIAPWIGNLTSLGLLDLSYNELKDSHLTGICEFRNLRNLYLSNNKLGGAIPQCLGNKDSLEDLFLDNNWLRGSIPPLDNMTAAAQIVLSNNELDGMFTFSMFANFSHLTKIDLSNNPQLEVETEVKSWVPTFQLEYLGLSNCIINKGSGGGIPSILAAQNQLKELNLSRSNLKGTIPSWLFYNKSSLEFLDASANSLLGSFPQPSQNSTSSIYSLLGQQLPKDRSIVFPSLLYLDLSSNALEGEIPSYIASAAELQVLDLSNNKLSGDVPHQLTNSSFLEFLVLSNNTLGGDMLRRYHNMTYLKGLFIDGNGFTGTISDGLHSSTDLMVLNIKNNFLSGSIPGWLQTFSNLQMLLLGGNKFVGHIPKELCQLKNLKLLDLSQNNLSGNIPPCLTIDSSWGKERFTFNTTVTSTTNGMRLFEFGSSTWVLTIDFTTKGITYTYGGLPLSLMNGIDLSANRLTGNIPPEMGYMKGLHSLNLSNNRLTGNFPESFQYLEQLESLDISHNMLTGSIPPQITQLNFISVFNVSYNNLSGKLPDLKNQFSTFGESSYMGNPMLCGEPLKRKCSPNNPSEHHYNEEEDELGIIDNPILFYSFVAISFALGFWSFIAFLFFKQTWRQRFFISIDGCINSCCVQIWGLLCRLKNCCQ